MSLARFTKNARQVLNVAQKEAERFQHEAINTEHLLLGLVKVKGCDAQLVLQMLNITDELLSYEFTQLFPPSSNPSVRSDLPPDTQRALELAVEIGRQRNLGYISTNHLLMGLTQLREGGAYRLFKRLDVSTDRIYKNALAAIKNAESDRGVKTQQLESTARNQTQRAQKWNLPLVAGRVYHMERVQQILARLQHKKVLLVGHPGTGKTTIVDAIVDRFVREGRNEIVWQASYTDLIDLGVMNLTRERGLPGLIRELEDSQHILHITDAPHEFFVQGIKVISVMQLLMQADIRLIQECSLDFYEEHLEDNSYIQRHVSVLMVGPLPVEDTRTVLIARKAEFEAHHEVEYLDSAIEAILEYADDVMPFLYNPDQALQFMDEVGAVVASREDLKSPISDETVVSIVNYLTGDNEF